MRIMLVISDLRRGGAERVLSVMANHWAECGHEVFLVIIGDKQGGEYYLRPEIVRIELNLERKSRNPIHGLWCNLRRIIALRKTARHIQPYAAVSFMTHTNLLVLLALAGSGLPVIVSERIDPAQWPVGVIREQLRRWLYPRAARVVLQTERVLKQMQFAWPRATCVAIPNPVPETDPDEPHASVISDQAAWRMGWSKVVCAMGRLDDQKGFDLLIEAFGKLHATHPDWHLVIFGEGSARASLEQQVAALKLQTCIHLPGVVHAARRHLEESDIFVLSSRFEGFPNALVEAMACGLPVISFDCPSGPGEIIRRGHDGLLVPAGDVAGLAAALGSLMDDVPRRLQLGQNARQVLERFSVRRIMGQWDDLLASITRIVVIGDCTPALPNEAAIENTGPEHASHK